MTDPKKDALSVSLQGLWVVIGRYNLARGREFFDLDFRNTTALSMLSFRENDTMIYWGVSFDSQAEYIVRMQGDRLYLNRKGDGCACIEPLCFCMELSGDRLTLTRLGYVEYDDQDKAVGPMQPVSRTVLVRYARQVNWQAEKDKEYRAATERGVILITLELVERIMDRLHNIHVWRKERLRRQERTESPQAPSTPEENETGR